MADAEDRFQLTGEPIQDLALTVFADVENNDSDYGNYAFLLPAPDTDRLTSGCDFPVSLDRRYKGGEVEILPLAAFCGRVITSKLANWTLTNDRLVTSETLQRVNFGLSYHLASLIAEQRRQGVIA